MLNLFFVTGTYGSGKTPCFVYCAHDTANGLTWYVCEGSVNVNATYEDIKDGVNVEELSDNDMFTAGSPINSLEELETAIND